MIISAGFSCFLEDVESIFFMELEGVTKLERGSFSSVLLENEEEEFLIALSSPMADFFALTSEVVVK